MTTENNRSDTATYNDQRTGKFVAGNPGRPKGAKTKFSQATLREIANLKDDALQVLKNRLAADDGDAAKWVLERVIGKNARFVELSGVSPGSIGDDLMDGSLTVDEAKDLALAISRLMQAEKLERLELEIAELRRLLGGGETV